jgi:hypothetical protein
MSTKTPKSEKTVDGREEAYIFSCIARDDIGMRKFRRDEYINTQALCSYDVAMIRLARESSRDTKQQKTILSQRATIAKLRNELAHVSGVRDGHYLACIKYQESTRTLLSVAEMFANAIGRKA